VRKTVFREEAISTAATGWLGEIRIASPIKHTVWATCAVLCGTAIVLWLYFGEYTRRERVQGLVVPTSGLAKIRSRSAGDVTEVRVAEGDFVKKGQEILVVDAERYLDNAEGLSERVAETLIEQQSTLRDDLETTQSIASRQQDGLRRQISLVREQAKQNEREIAIQRAEAAEQAALLQRVEALQQKGYVSLTDVQRQRTTTAMSNASVTRLLANSASLQQQLQDMEDRLARIPLDMASQLNESSRQLARMDAELGQNALDGSYTIRAPIDGIVSSLLVHPGQTVMNGQSLATIVPQGAKMEVDLLVATGAVGFIRAGNKVSIRYRAYPFQKFGVHSGRVRSRSNSAMSPSEILDIFGIVGATEPHYRVRVELASQSVQTYDDAKPLVAGMAVDADIMLDRRRMYEWLFEPVYTMRKNHESAP
jgi:membrane fusion protein